MAGVRQMLVVFSHGRSVLGKRHQSKASHQMEGYPEGPLGKGFISIREVPDV